VRVGGVRAAGAAVVAAAVAATVVSARHAPAELAPPAQRLRVVAVPGLGLDALPALAARGAVGMVVPGAGPRTSQREALAAIASGEVRNSLRRGGGTTRRLVRVELAAEPPTEGRVVVVGVPVGGRQRNDRRYPVAVVAPGYGGLLTSRSTRIVGLVSAADIAPTALGRPGRLAGRPSADPVAALARLDRRIRDNGVARPLAMSLLCAAVILLARFRPPAALGALVAGLAGNLGLGLAGTSGVAAVAAAGVAAAACAAIAGRRRWSRLVQGAVAAGVVGAYAVALWLAPAAVALSPLGPTQNSRFYGLSNLLETALVAPVVVAAAALVGAAGWVGLAVAAVTAVPVFALRALGADGGGAAVCGVALSAVAVEVRRLPRRALLVAVPASAVLAVGLVRLDALAGGTSHLTRALDRGIGAELVERVALSAARLTTGPAPAVITAAAVVVLVLLHRATVRRVSDRAIRAPAAATALAVAASLVVNDSPPEVAVLGVVGYLAIAVSLWPQAAGGSTSARATAAGERTIARRKGPAAAARTSVVPPGPGATQTRPASTAQ
jgi:hypothetical protein